jgi:hypothetical protein
MVLDMKETKVMSQLRPQTSSIRWNEDDWRLIAGLQKKTGIRSVAELVRKALRDCAQKEGLK